MRASLKKHHRLSHWTPFSVTNDMIELYDDLNTKGCTDKLLFEDLHDQPIPPDYYDLLNDNDDDDNNTTRNTIYNIIP